MDKKNIMQNKKKLSPKSLSIEKLFYMKKEPVWSYKTKEWFIVFNYAHNNKESFIGFIDQNGEMIYMDSNTITEECFYDINNLTKIGGDGDLLYCQNCEGDLSQAYVENIDNCPYCEKFFTNIKQFRNR